MCQLWDHDFSVWATPVCSTFTLALTLTLAIHTVTAHPHPHDQVEICGAQMGRHIATQ